MFLHPGRLFADTPADLGICCLHVAFSLHYPVYVPIHLFNCLITLCMLGKISTDNIFIYIFFLFCPGSRIWHFMLIVYSEGGGGGGANCMKCQILLASGDNLYEMSNPTFWKKKKGNSISLWSAEFAHSMLSLKCFKYIEIVFSNLQTT